MGLIHIEESKILKKEFNKIGREGITKRAIFLLEEYIKNNPEHHYKELTKLIGKFHALYIAIDNNDYWKEIANRGYKLEINDLQNWEEIKWK